VKWIVIIPSLPTPLGALYEHYKHWPWTYFWALAVSDDHWAARCDTRAALDAQPWVNRLMTAVYEVERPGVIERQGAPYIRVFLARLLQEFLCAWILNLLHLLSIDHCGTKQDARA